MFELRPQCAILLEDTQNGKCFKDDTFQTFVRTHVPDVNIYDDGFGFIRFDITDVNIARIVDTICQYFGNGVFISKELLIPEFKIARQFKTVADWIPIEEMNFYKDVMNTYIDYLEIEEKLATPLR
jgi:hypothetical protein